MKLAGTDNLTKAKDLLAQAKWQELLVLCHKVGLKKAPFILFWMTAACALEDLAEISNLIAKLRALDRHESVFQEGKLLTRLVSILESTNHAPQAGEVLLVCNEKFEWSPNDTKKANRMARVIMADHPQTSADLILVVGEKVGWEVSEIPRVEKLAKRLAEESPEKSAELLLAIHRQSPWTTTQCADASHLITLLAGTPQAEALQTCLDENEPKSDEEITAEGADSNFHFAAYRPDDKSFVAPDQFSFEVYRSSENLVSCEERFRNFQLKFLPTLAQKKAPPVSLIKDAYVNKIGQVWTKSGAIINKIGQKIANPKPSNVRMVEHGTAVMTSTKGIYHWLAETLPSISWTCLPGAEQIKIVVPTEMPAFKTDSLRFVGVGDDKLVRLQEEACFFENLYVTPGSNSNLFFAQDFYRQLIERANQESTIPRAEKIYISRRDSNRRILENEAQFEKELEARGFHIAILSGKPLADQIALFANASTIVAPHGGGLTHLIFARPGTQVIEIVPATDQISDASIHLRFNYARVSMIKGLQYHLFLEECHMTLTAWKANLPPILRLIDSLA